MIIRKGNSSDLNAVTTCINEAYASYIPRIGKRPASMDTDFAPVLRERKVWVAEIDGSVVGLMVLIDKPDFIEIRSVAVLPRHQRQGIGRRLMSHAEQVARETRRPTLRLYTNAKIPELLTYCSAMGYQEVERRQDQGHERVFMAKRIKIDG